EFNVSTDVRCRDLNDGRNITLADNSSIETGIDLVCFGGIRILLIRRAGYLFSFELISNFNVVRL
ncbi:unnamed protein product, partial [Adineta steineri]